MDKHNKESQSRILGIDREQVDYDIHQLKKEHAEKLEQIKKQIEALKLENDCLSKHCDNLKKEIKTEMQPTEFMEYALKKADEYTPLFDKAAQREIEDITSIGEKTEVLFNQKIAEFEEKIKETQAFLDNILKDILDKNEHLTEKVKDFIEKEGSYKFIPHRQGSSKPRSVKMRATQTQEVTNILAKPIENKKTEIIPYQEQNTTVKESKLDKKESTELKKEVQSADSKQMFDQVLDQDLSNYSGVSEEKLAEKANEDFQKANLRHEDIEESPREPQITKAIEINRTPQNEERPIYKANTENKAITIDISNIRSKYLIGKVAGADLLDKDRRVIVAKNAVITNEIVDKAEKEGKLAELIVNMALPDDAD